MKAKYLAAVTVMLIICAAGSSRASADVSAQTRSPHGNLNIPCQNCHTSIGWKPIRAIPEFDHNRTSYPLRGRHESVTCTQCHTKPVFSNVGSKCADCHADIHRGQMGARCESCHTVKGWNVAIKDIQNHENRFPLVGAHAALQCDDCHKSAAVGQFQGLSTQCYSCHANDFKKATNPNHVSGGFSTQCQTCHTADTWLNAKFDHSQTGFPLTGLHQQVACAQCHVNNNYNLTSANTTCVSCHLPDYQKTTNPNHAAAGISQTCEQCHTTAGWTTASFDHTAAGFPLTGGHANVQCSQCHVNNNYNLTSKTCSTCHMPDYNNTNNPNHAQQGIPTTCETCHTIAGWIPASFDHSKTGFQLTNAHAVPPRQCSDCHVNNNYNLTNTACVSCHQTDYNNATTPVNHVQLNFPTTCQQCHDTVLWTDGKFDHSSTGWPLTGFHLTSTQCSQCHINNNYNLTSADTACVKCHQTDYNNATTPINHVQQNFPTTCQQCHDTVDWMNGKFDHSSTGWPLTGFHLTSTQCTQCHVNNNYNLTSADTACVHCHQTDYNGATTPINHVQLGFPTTCQNCHDTVNWMDGTFDHSSTGWPLTGFHLTSTQCAQCHINNNYNLTSANTSCVGCHQTDYNNAKTPINHVQLGFPTACQNCHDTVDWMNGKFDHSTTGWALTGFHLTSTQCSQCHINNNYNLTIANTVCSGCHLQDYNGATTPVNHVAAGFPITCELCHDTVDWMNGKFDHTTTGWPLTGFHLTSTQCSQCHINNNYKLTNTACVACHQTDYNGTNNPPHVASGFPTTCQLCHDTVNWMDGTFDHTSTGWPLTGFHLTSTQCAQCHVNNNYSLTSANTVCSSCHMADWNMTNNPVHSATGWPTTCNTCHTTTAWIPATLPLQYHTMWDPNHGGANSVCATCHTNPNDYSVFQCTNCHGKSSTDSNHQGVSGYVYNSVNCYNCHKGGGGGGGMQ